MTSSLTGAGVDALWLRWLPSLAAVPQARTAVQVIEVLSAKAAD